MSAEPYFMAGFGTGSLSVYEPGTCMFGWGHPRNVTEGDATGLRARAMVLEERATGRRVAYVCCDLGLISEAVRRGAVNRLCTPAFGLTEHDVMITATHTHSAPGGSSTYVLYALSIPGVSERVIKGLVDGICAAVSEAVTSLREARVWFTSGWLPASEPVAFNRSIEAYNRNEDASPVTWERRDEAVERTMTVLRVDDARGAPMGLVSWFPVHGTSVHSDNRRLHDDNKGYAARLCEAWARERGYAGFTALFAQESAGDVSPNYRWSASRSLMVGRFPDDDDASARFNGEVQARHARALWAEAREGDELRGPLVGALRYRDFFDLRAGDEPSARTTRPRLGASFSVGTLEGQGPFFALRAAVPWLTRMQSAAVRRGPPDAWQAAHGGKPPFWDLGIGRENRVLGVMPLVNPILHLMADRFVDYYRRAVDWPFARDLSWVPRYLPVQQLRIGPLLVVGLPIEPTTMAGRRLRASLLTDWAGDVEHVVINGYANAYCSYLTTPEEYGVQRYEGASTLYGQWSLPVFRSELGHLTREMREGRAQATLGAVPPEVPIGWCLAR